MNVVQHLGRLAGWSLLVAALAGVASETFARIQAVQGPVVRQSDSFVLTEDQFNRWAFGAGTNAESIRNQLYVHLMSKIDEIERACKITDDQKTRLITAGRGDIKHYFDRVADLRSQYLNVKLDMIAAEAAARELGSLQVATYRVESVFSLLTKMTPGILTPEQTVLHATFHRERRLFRHHARVGLVVAILDDAVGLRSSQRERLQALLEETQPPEKPGPYDYQVVLLQTARLPEAKIKPIFDDVQWRVLSGELERTRQIEPFLVKSGYLPGKTTNFE